jgi:large conductance mechanosensitive channel
MKAIKDIKPVSGFINFIRQQGVVGLAIGLILGGAVSGLVDSVVKDLLQPLINIMIGSKEGLSSFTLNLSGIEIFVGRFAVSLIDFVVIAGVVYFIFKGLRLDRLDKEGV